MTRSRTVVLAAVLVVFLAAGAYLLFGRSGGGKNVVFNVSVQNSKMTPTDSLEARQGDTITVNLTSDKAQEIHLHGYDIKFAAEPGKTVSKTFKADRTCDCEIEIEDTSTRVGSLTVKP